MGESLVILAGAGLTLRAGTFRSSAWRFFIQYVRRFLTGRTHITHRTNLIPEVRGAFGMDGGAAAGGEVSHEKEGQRTGLAQDMQLLAEVVF